MELSHGIVIKSSNGKTRVLKLWENLHDSKQVGGVWNEYMKKGLQRIRFTKCVYYHNDLPCFYVDDGVFLSPNEENIKQDVQQLTNVDFDLEYLCHISHYFRIIFYEIPIGRIYLSLPRLIDEITKETGIKDHIGWETDSSRQH